MKILMLMRTSSISKLSLLIILSISTTLTQAEVVLDGTVGIAVALEGPNFDIKAELGQQHGNNLFHSFKWFNLNKEETATFSGTNQITNIITRVTGGKLSSIDGQLISNIPQADLYLINPDGFVFGPNANLDLQGSLHISTASQVRLGKTGLYEARHPENSLLISAPPSAFGFLDKPASIEIKESQLTIGNNQTLSILGGEIHINKGILKAISGRINLAAITKANELKSTETGLNIDSDAQLGKIVLEGDSNIDVGKEGAGEIYIRSGQFFLEQSNMTANNEINENQGLIGIHVNEIYMNNANIDSRAFGPGTGGQIHIEVAGKTTLENGSQIRTTSLSSHPKAGNAGHIFLTSQYLELLNSTISTRTIGPGKGGNMIIKVEQNLNLIGKADAPSTIQASSKTSGHAGRIFIRARNLSLTGYASIDNSTEGIGHGGNITLDLYDKLSLNNNASITADSFGLGNAGHIYAHATTIAMNRGTISTATNNADGGNIIINTHTRLIMNNSLISATVSGGIGNGGNLAIGSPRFFNLTDSKMIANASGGNGGLILIITGTPKNLLGSLIAASSETGLDGEVKIDNIYNANVNTLPISFLDADILIKQHCVGKTHIESSRFFIKGRCGLPNAPDDLQSYFPQDELLVD